MPPRRKAPWWASQFANMVGPFLRTPPNQTPDPNNNNNSVPSPEERPATILDPKRLKMAPSTPQAAPAAPHFDKEESVTLIVGPEKRELLVHANHIARNSEFFKTALKKEWREGQARTVSMPTDDYETMNTYLRFVYGSQLPTEIELCPRSGDYRTATVDELEDSQNAYMSFTKLYILGCRLMDKTFMEAATAKMLDLFDTCYECFVNDSLFNPGPISVNAIYEETLEMDPVRRLVVDMYIKHPQDLNSQYNSGFLLDLAQGFSKRAQSQLVPWTQALQLRNYMRIPQ